MHWACLVFLCLLVGVVNAITSPNIGNMKNVWKKHNSVLQSLITSIHKELTVTPSSLRDEVSASFLPKREASLRSTSQTASITSFTRTFNSVIYGPDNVTMSEVSGFGLDCCIPNPQSDAPPDSVYTSVLSSNSTSITLLALYYKGTDSCDSTVSTPTSHSKTFPVWKPYTLEYTECANNGGITITFESRQHVYIAETATPFTSFPSGQILQLFYNDPQCHSTTYLAYTWFAFPQCGNPLTENGYCDQESAFALGPYEAKVSTYEQDCSVLAYTVTSSLDLHCTLLDPTSLEYQAIYYTKASSGDDDSVSLSKSEYGGLIASVFIALTVGVVGTALAFIYCFGATFTSGPLVEKLV